MKAITIDIALIIQSMRDLCRMKDDYYLDRTTGDVISLSRQLVRSLEQDRSSDKEDLPQWDVRMMPVAREIVLMGSQRYLRIPEAFGYPEHKWMTEFVHTIPSHRDKEKLLLALRGRGACQRFKDFIKDDPEVQKRWHVFRISRWEALVQNWLEPHGLLAISSRPTFRLAS